MIILLVVDAKVFYLLPSFSLPPFLLSLAGSSLGRLLGTRHHHSKYSPTPTPFNVQPDNLPISLFIA